MQLRSLFSKIYFSAEYIPWSVLIWMKVSMNTLLSLYSRSAKFWATKKYFTKEFFILKMQLIMRQMIITKTTFCLSDRLLVKFVLRGWTFRHVMSTLHPFKNDLPTSSQQFFVINSCKIRVWFTSILRLSRYHLHHVKNWDLQ
jgi:hypothetical protein